MERAARVAVDVLLVFTDDDAEPPEVQRGVERLQRIVGPLDQIEPHSYCTLALFEHEGAESGLINLQARFLGHLQGQVDREAVRVMEGEGFGTGQRNAGSLGFRYGIFQPCGA